ncbi:TIGR03086 family metal-binding protein [Streptomyces sp. ISL-21]|uniref:TIGR03086 family metal-binding protein n=1 Tax=Streptomyces sp. ISL-21 TaxID=2819179 RepID=UPI001BEA230A|nr:TIGR03086 family metal-binding protein [Streptomyces sp. ISL-21]MBT2404204.1 TIGR03086 family protein [Streptomyces sp. ISL-21]
MNAITRPTEAATTAPSEAPSAVPSGTPSGTPSPAVDPRLDLAAAVSLAGRTLAAVRADQYDAPTPCEEFDVRRLSSHLVAVLRRIAVIGRGEAPFSVPSFADELADGEWEAAWEAASSEVAQVWADPEILGRTLQLPAGPMPGAAAAAAYTNELTVHTWDLATATGQRPAWDPALLERVLSVVRRTLPAGTRGGRVPYGEVVAVDADAPAIDRLVGWAGRRP